MMNDECMLLVCLQIISLCFSVTLMFHYVINDIFVARSVVCYSRRTTSDPLRSNATRTSPPRWLSSGIMLSTAALGITCVIVRLMNVVKSASAGERHVSCSRHLTKSADDDWWMLVERAVELTFAFAIETTTWRSNRRSPVRRYTINQTCSPETESGEHRVGFATKREQDDGHKRLELFSPLRRIGRHFKSAWWRRRSAGASRIKLGRSSTSEFSNAHHHGRQVCNTIEQHEKQFPDQLVDEHDHHHHQQQQRQWSSWKRMLSENRKITGTGNRCSIAKPPSTAAAVFNRQYFSVGDFDDEITGSGCSHRQHRRERPTSALLVNDGGFIRFRTDGDPDGLPISMSSDDDDDEEKEEEEEEEDAICHSSDRESDYEYESKSVGLMAPTSGADKQQQQPQLCYHPLVSLSLTSRTMEHRHASLPVSGQYRILRMLSADLHGGSKSSVRASYEYARVSPTFPQTGDSNLNYGPISLLSTETAIEVADDDVISEFMIPSMDLAESIDRALDKCGS